MGKKRKDRGEPFEVPVDLASRIGGAGAPEPVATTAPAPVRRVDGPIEASRTRPQVLIGANEPVPAPLPERLPEPAVAADPSIERPTMIGLEELLATTVAAPAAVAAPQADGPMTDVPLVSVREAPGAGEMDLVVTPLSTPDDWHHFELALRRVPGVGQLRIEYYRAGILKLRVSWSGVERFADALTRVPGYRVGILGEDRTTVQIRVAKAA